MPASNFSRISYSKRALRLVAMMFSSDAADFLSFALMATRILARAAATGKSERGRLDRPAGQARMIGRGWQVIKESTMSAKGKTPSSAEAVRRRAIEMGAAGAKIISPDKVFTAAWVRWKCRFGCSAFGFEPSLSAAFPGAGRDARRPRRLPQRDPDPRGRAAGHAPHGRRAGTRSFPQRFLQGVRLRVRPLRPLQGMRLR